MDSQTIPNYLYDSSQSQMNHNFYSKKCQVLPFDNSSIIEEDELFRPISPISWDTPADELLNRLPYGVFLQILFSNFEKGIIPQRSFIPLLEKQMVYFFQGLKTYAMGNTWNKRAVRRIVSHIVNSLPITKHKLDIISSILFKIEDKKVSSIKQDSIVDSINERMKQIASMNAMKRKMTPGSTLECPIHMMTQQSPYACDMIHRYHCVSHTDLSGEIFEYGLLKNMKQNIINVYGTEDSFAKANIWQIISNLFGVNDPNEISQVALLAEKDMEEVVEDKEAPVLYEIPSYRPLLREQAATDIKAEPVEEEEDEGAGEYIEMEKEDAPVEEEEAEPVVEDGSADAEQSEEERDVSPITEGPLLEEDESIPDFDLEEELQDEEAPVEEDTLIEEGEEDLEAPVEEDTLIEEGEEDLEAPIEDAVEAPIEDAVEAPIEDAVEAPIEDDIEAPIEDDVEAPIEEGEYAVEAPIEEGEYAVEAPIEDDEEAPVEDDEEAPVEDDEEAPIEEDVEAPIEDDIEAPIEEEEDAVEAPIEEEEDVEDDLEAPIEEEEDIEDEEAPVEEDEDEEEEEVDMEQELEEKGEVIQAADTDISYGRPRPDQESDTQFVQQREEDKLFKSFMEIDLTPYKVSTYVSVSAVSSQSKDVLPEYSDKKILSELPTLPTEITVEEKETLEKQQEALKDLVKKDSPSQRYESILDSMKLDEVSGKEEASGSITKEDIKGVDVMGAISSDLNVVNENKTGIYYL